MINTSFNLASIAGIIIAVAGAALYAVRSYKPELSRDHDIFFSAVGLLCGLILVFYGWRFDPIMQFGQILLTGATIFFAAENLRLRSVTTEQAKRNMPIVDEDRPVSRVYETVHAELDELEPLEDERPPARRQIRGSRDARSNRTAEYDEAPRRRRTTDESDDEGRDQSSYRSSSQNLGQADKPRRRSSRPASRPVERTDDDWDSPNSSNSNNDWDSPSKSSNRPSDDWNVSDSSVSKSSRPSSSSSRIEGRSSDTSSKPRRRRPPQDSAYRREADGSVTPTDYVDYKPVEKSGDQPDDSSFDKF